MRPDARKLAVSFLLLCLAAFPSLFAQGLEPAFLGSTENVHRYGAIWLASQPAKEDLQIAGELGVLTVICLRKPEEIDWDEAEAVRALGLSYLNPAFQSPEELTDETLQAVRRELSAGRPMLLHCGTANRVGALWLAYRALDGGLTYGEALCEAEAVGLKSAALRERVRSYIAEHERDSEDSGSLLEHLP